jgi:hypothetical protein
MHRDFSSAHHAVPRTSGSRIESPTSNSLTHSTGSFHSPNADGTSSLVRSDDGRTSPSLIAAETIGTLVSSTGGVAAKIGRWESNSSSSGSNHTSPSSSPSTATPKARPLSMIGRTMPLRQGSSSGINLSTSSASSSSNNNNNLSLSGGPTRSMRSNSAGERQMLGCSPPTIAVVDKIDKWEAVLASEEREKIDSELSYRNNNPNSTTTTTTTTKLPSNTTTRSLATSSSAPTVVASSSNASDGGAPANQRPLPPIPARPPLDPEALPVFWYVFCACSQAMRIVDCQSLVLDTNEAVCMLNVGCKTVCALYVCVCVCRQREVGAKLWIEQILSISLPPAYIPLLCDGVILCKLMSAINEKWIPKIYEPFGKMNKVPLFHTKKNLTFFLGACEEELLLPAYVEPNTPPLVHSSCNSDGCK